MESEEDILIRLPEPQGDWRVGVEEARQALGPGHTQQWLAWMAGLPNSTLTFYMRTGRAPYNRVERIHAVLRSEVQAHRKGECSKARFLSPLHLPEPMWPFPRHPESAPFLAAA